MSVLEERLKLLESNVAELSKMAESFTSQELKEEKHKQWALRYGLFESIQLIIDICCHITAKQNLGSTKNYRDCAEALQQFDIIDDALALKIKAMIGLRNILIHEYVAIDEQKLIQYLDNLDDFRSFAAAIFKYLEI